MLSQLSALGEGLVTLPSALLLQTWLPPDTSAALTMLGLQGNLDYLFCECSFSCYQCSFCFSPLENAFLCCSTRWMISGQMLDAVNLPCYIMVLLCSQNGLEFCTLPICFIF